MDQLINQFTTPDKKAALKNLKMMADKLQIQLQEVLVQDFAAAGRSRHPDEFGSAVQTHRHMAAPGEFDQVAPRTTADIEDRERSLPGGSRPGVQCIQQGCHVLADVMIPGPFAEALGMAAVMRNGAGYGIAAGTHFSPR